MKNKQHSKKSKIEAVIIALLFIGTTVIVPVSTIAQNTQSTQKTIKSNEGSKQDLSNLQYSFLFNEPGLQQTKLYGTDFTSINMPGTLTYGNNVGEPVTQSKSVRLLLPRGYEINTISVTGNTLIEINTISKGYDLTQKPITPYQQSVPIGEKLTGYLFINEEVYEDDSLLPVSLYENLGVGYCRGYAILTINLYPLKYSPGLGKLYYYDQMTISLDLKETGYINEFYRGNVDDEAWVQSLVHNPGITTSYSNGGLGGAPLYDGGICSPSDNEGLGYDYVIITRAALFDFTATYNWDSLISRKQAEGLQATKVTVENILSTHAYMNSNALFNDTPARIREFCKDAYQDWGTSYILIGGDSAGTNAIERRLMDYAYESDVETDIYWTHLDNTFNSDNDANWGEEGDAGFDLFSEMYSGSIPCDEGIDISNWLTKSFFYADAVDMNYLENAAFYGGDTGWDCQGDDFIDYSAIKGTTDWLGPDPHNDGPYPTWMGFQYGFETWNLVNPGLPYDLSVKWTAESPNPGWQGGSESAAITGLKNAINNNQCTLISAIAHSNEDMSMDVASSSWESEYHNTMPFFLTDYGCHNGDMNAADEGVLHSMLFHSTELAFGCVYNTGYGWGNLGSTNSSSAFQQKAFWDYLFDVTNNSGGSMNWQLGKAQEWARDIMAPTIGWDASYGTWRGIIECCLLFGDPAQLIKPPITAEHNIGVQSLDVDTYVTPDQMTTVTATIINNGLNDEEAIVVSFRVDGAELGTQTIASLAKNTAQQVSFSWTPAWGSYIVSIYASITGVTEEFTIDNEKSKLVIAGPDISVTDLVTPTYAGVNVLTPIQATINNLGAATETVTVNLLVNGVISDTKTKSINSGASSVETFNWNPTDVGTYPVGISAEITSGSEPYTGNNEMTKDISVFIALGYVLLVDDDIGDAYEIYYENALLASGYLYTYWDRASQGSPPPATMAAYSAVIWFTGDDSSTTLVAEDITNLKTYLDAGGRLFITGQDIGYDINTDSFYANYLHATYGTDDTNILRLYGAAGDPIGNGLVIDISSGDGANNQAWPSGITPISPATTVFDYESSTYDAGISLDNTVYHIVYFAFGFEAISSQNDRTTVMTRVLAWLAGEVTTPEIWIDPTSFDVTVPLGGILYEPLTIGNDAEATDDLIFSVEIPHGWDVQWEHQYGGNGDAQMAQPVGDIDEDGMNEVIVGGYAGYNAHILSYNSGTGAYDEEYVWSEGGGVPSGASVVDLDDNGENELVVSWVYGSANGIYAYDWDGTTLTTLNSYSGTGFTFAYDVYSCDYDDDGDVEVLIANDPDSSSGYHVTALGWNSVSNTFTYEVSWFSGTVTECPMVWSGDTDNDGKTEVIASAGSSAVYALNYAAGAWTATTVASGLPVHPYGVSVGDLDSDGIPEIGFGLDDTHAYLYEWTGSSYAQVWSGYYSGEESIIEATAIGDADNDGQNEFLIGTNIIHVISYTGGNYIEESTITATAGQLAGTIIGDCDTDGLNEVKANDILTSPAKEWIIEYIPAATWLSVAPTSGTVLIGEQTDLTVTLDATSLLMGTYSSSLIIHSNDLDESQITIPVNIQVIPTGPYLSYSPHSYNFGGMKPGETASTTFQVWNAGTETVSYTLSESASWLTVSPTSGDSAGEHDTITVNIDTTGLSDGTYQCPIAINSNGGNGVFTAYVTVQTPILSYNPTSHNFGSMLEGQTNSATFEIWNGGNGPLTYSFSESASWVTVTPLSGTSSGEHDTITVSIDTTGLAIGPYVCDIIITSTGGSGIFSLSVLVIPEEELDQSQSLFTSSYALYTTKWAAQSFKPSYDVLTRVQLYIRKSTTTLTTAAVLSVRSSLTGADLISISVPASQISTSFSWVWFDFTDLTVTPGATYYLVLRTSGGSSSAYYAWGYATGSPYANGNVYSSSTSGSSWTANAAYDFCFMTYGMPSMPPVPVLSYSPSSYDFGSVAAGATRSTTFEIWNTGTGTLSYTLTEFSSWATVTPISGSSTGEHDTITVNIDTTGLTPGSAYNCPVGISTNGGSGTFTVYVTIIVPNPVLAYTPTSYDFGDKLEGQTALTTFEIWNSGTGALTYSLSESSSWITSVSPASGSSSGEHDTITIAIDTTGLSVGSYSSDVAIISDGGSGTFTVTVTVIPPAPILSYTPTSYNFGDMIAGATSSTSFQIWNSGTGTLTYSLSETSSWVTVTPLSGTSTGEHDTITVNVDTTGLTAGSYSCPISISSDGGSGTFTVYVNIVTVVPVLAYTPTSYSFGSMEAGHTASTTFQIWNSGTGTLTYSFSESASWVTVSPTSGSSTGEHDTITINVDTTGLSVGSYSCPISISSNGGSGTFTVSLNVIVLTEALDQQQTTYSNNFALYTTRWGGQSFIPTVTTMTRVELYMRKAGTPPADAVLSVRSSISGVDLVSVSKPASAISTTNSWVEFNFADLSVTAGSTYYLVLRTSSGSSTNCYYWGYGSGSPYANGLLYYSATGGSSWTSYATYDFCFKTYGISAPPTPALSYNPTSYSFGSVAAGYTGSTTFEIWNSGTGTLTYTLSESTSWATVSPTSGSSTGEHDTITVSINTAGLTPGSYSCPVSISSIGGTGTFTATVTIISPTPTLAYNPTSYAFGDMTAGSTSSTTFEVWNSGTGILTYSLAESTSWISSVSPTSGTSTGEHDTITVGIDTTGMSVGSYNGPVSITSDGGSGTFTVSVNIVTVAPALSYTPTSYTFSSMTPGHTASTTFQIWNSGTGGTLTYTLTESATWVTVSPTSGSSTGEHDTITVTVDTTGLTPGSYTCPVSISSSAGSGTFTVYLTVIAATETIDQQQITYTTNFALYTTRWGGQAFKPTLGTLTRVELYMKKAGTPPADVTLSVRSSISGADLVSVSKPASAISTTNGWVDFDFTDLTVTPGTTYYLVLKTTSGTSTSCYYWGYGTGSPYANGNLWYSATGGSSWTEYPTYDFCFKTYGLS